MLTVTAVPAPWTARAVGHKAHVIRSAPVQGSTLSRDKRNAQRTLWLAQAWISTSEPEVSTTLPPFNAQLSDRSCREHHRRQDAYPFVQDPEAVSRFLLSSPRTVGRDLRKFDIAGHRNLSKPPITNICFPQPRPCVRRLRSYRQAPQEPWWSWYGRWSAPPPYQHRQVPPRLLR